MKAYWKKRLTIIRSNWIFNSLALPSYRVRDSIEHWFKTSSKFTNWRLTSFARFVALLWLDERNGMNRLGEVKIRTYRISLEYRWSVGGSCLSRSRHRFVKKRRSVLCWEERFHRSDATVQVRSPSIVDWDPRRHIERRSRSFDSAPYRARRLLGSVRSGGDVCSAVIPFEYHRDNVECRPIEARILSRSGGNILFVSFVRWSCLVVHSIVSLILDVVWRSVSVSHGPIDRREGSVVDVCRPCVHCVFSVRIIAEHIGRSSMPRRSNGSDVPWSDCKHLRRVCIRSSRYRDNEQIGSNVDDVDRTREKGDEREREREGDSEPVLSGRSSSIEGVEFQTAMACDCLLPGTCSVRVVSNARVLLDTDPTLVLDSEERPLVNLRRGKQLLFLLEWNEAALRWNLVHWLFSVWMYSIYLATDWSRPWRDAIRVHVDASVVLSPRWDSRTSTSVRPTIGAHLRSTRSRKILKLDVSWSKAKFSSLGQVFAVHAERVTKAYSMIPGNYDACVAVHRHPRDMHRRWGWANE